MRPRDTPEYRRITEIISELVDLRARVEKSVGAGASGDVGSTGAFPPGHVRLRGYRPSVSNTDKVVAETDGSNKKKKKKKKKGQIKSDGAGPVDHPVRVVESVGRPRRSSAPSQPAVSGKCAGVSVPPVLQDPQDTWTTVVRRNRKNSGPLVSSLPQQRKNAGASAGDQRTGSVRAGMRQQRTAVNRPAARKVPKTAAVSVLCTTPGQYEAIIAEAKRKIKLPDLGIQKGLKFKRAITGALTLEGVSRLDT